MKKNGRRPALPEALLLALFLGLALAGCPGREPRTPQAKGRPTKLAGPGTGAARAPDDGGEAGARLPWQDDPEFLRAQREAATPTLMASFHATLPDPIGFERHNIALAADYLKGAVVKPGEVFALNARIGRCTTGRGFKLGPEYRGGRIALTVGGGVCKVASVLYNAVILAAQPVVERHPHSMTVPYVPPGQDATISSGTADFRFRNASGAPILIWARNTGGTLYIALYGTARPPRVEWTHEVLRRTKTRTTYTSDRTLPKGATKVVQEGSDGIVVHSWVSVRGSDGRTVKKDLGVSAYRPAPRIVAVGR